MTATLTGVVKQPAPPYLPAPGSSVTVQGPDGRPLAAKDTTGNDGRYSFSVPFGVDAVVRASWREPQSTRGTTTIKVLSEPTTADVQLQPPGNAPEPVWYEAGRQTAMTSGNAVVFAAGSLYQQEVPAAALYQFIRGARSTHDAAFGNLARTKMFSVPDATVVAAGVRETEKQFAATGRVPKFDELRFDVPGSLSKEQYIEILAFVSPPKGSDRSKWDLALEGSLDLKGFEGVKKKSEFFDIELKQSEASTYWKAAEDGSQRRF